ncbi:hypothetical protein [Rhizobium sp. LjRoot258]|uniref:hypothetical protein n=1 Tax=Rhizobium sp. LjRoot258 TaxID=3342299 RepID=UPI003ED032C6
MLQRLVAGGWFWLSWAVYSQKALSWAQYAKKSEFLNAKKSFSPKRQRTLGLCDFALPFWFESGMKSLIKGSSKALITRDAG